jgi:hypothetical protein
MFKIILLLLAFNFAFFIVKSANRIIKTATSTQNATAHQSNFNKTNTKIKIDDKFKGMTTKIAEEIAEDIQWEDVQ